MSRRDTGKWPDTKCLVRAPRNIPSPAGAGEGGRRPDEGAWASRPFPPDRINAELQTALPQSPPIIDHIFLNPYQVVFTRITAFFHRFVARSDMATMGCSFHSSFVSAVDHQFFSSGFWCVLLRYPLFSTTAWRPPGNQIRWGESPREPGTKGLARPHPASFWCFNTLAAA